MSTVAAELEFAAGFVLFFVSAAGLIFSLTRADPLVTGWVGRSSAVLGFGCVAASEFIGGVLAIEDRRAPALVVLRVVGLILLVPVAVRWRSRPWGRALAGAGVVVLGVSELCSLADLDRLADWLELAGAVAIGLALLLAARRSISTRVAAFAAAIVLIVVLALSLALSLVLDRTIEEEAIQRLAAVAETEAELAARRGVTATSGAQILAAAMVSGAQGQAILRLADDTAPPEQLAADTVSTTVTLSGLVESFVRDIDPRVGPVLLVNPGGGVEVAVPADAAEVVELAGNPVMVEAIATQSARQSVTVLGDHGFGAAAEPVFVVDGTVRRFAGVVGVTSGLDDSYLETRAAGEAREVDGYGVALAAVGRTLAASGPRPPSSALADLAGDAIASGEGVDRVVGDRFVAAAPVLATNGAPVMAMVVSVPTTAIEQARATLFRSLFLVALIATVAALFLAGILGERIGSGVRRLTTAAREIRRGNLSATAGLSGPDELGELSTTFDSMSDSLRRMTGDLRRAADDERRLRNRVETIVSGMGEALVAIDDGARVTDFNAAAEELFGLPAARAVGRPVDTVVRIADADGVDRSDWLRQPLRHAWSQPVTVVRSDGGEIAAVITAGPLHDATDRVVGGVFVVRDVRREQEVDRMKSDFLATISHELRTPLTPIKGYAAVLSRRSLPETRVKEFAGEITLGVGHLERTVDQLVNFATMVAGRLELQREPVVVDRLLDRVVSRWRERVDPARHPISRVEPTAVPPVDADPRYLEQALDELVDNAIKYSPEGGCVILSAAFTGSEANGRIRLSVADEGVGVPSDRQTAIFDAFAQADSSATRRFGGLGLGLALVARIVRSHGGEPEFAPRPDGGTVFSVVLPVHRGTDGAGSG